MQSNIYRKSLPQNASPILIEFTETQKKGLGRISNICYFIVNFLKTISPINKYLV